MKCTSSRNEQIIFKYNLKNYINSTVFDFGSINCNLDSLGLIVNKQKCLQDNFIDNNVKNTASLMSEYTFLRNPFTEFPEGIIRLRVERIENLTLKKAFYSFNAGVIQNFYEEGPTYYVHTKSALDELSFNIYANKDLLEI